ncbi:MAG: FkbM family methyltransferase [Paracoccaceae bacterium]
MDLDPMSVSTAVQSDTGFLRSRGMRFPKNPEILRPRMRRALRANAYEGKEADAIKRIARPDDIALELGGGIGFMSTLMARNVGVAHVHVFEANPRLIPYIQSVHAANEIENATLYHAVLGARKGSAKFYVRKNFLGSSLSKTGPSPTVSVEDVPVQNVQKVMKAIKPTLLVCDIEGAEQDVIPLMDLSSVRAAVVELHPQWIGPEGVNKVFSAFMNAGLAYYARASTSKVVAFRRDWVLR